MSHVNGTPGSYQYTLSEALTALSMGIRFGDIYPHLDNPDDGERLKHCFVFGHINTSPTDTPLPIPTEESMLALKSTLTPALTGDFCPECGSGNVVRTGTCKTCQDCSHNEGCG